MTRCAWLALLVIIVAVGCSTRPGDPPAAISASTMVDGCLTTLATDKPRYVPGETVRIRVLVLKPDTLAPDLRPVVVTVTVLNPRRQTERILLTTAQDGAATVDWPTAGLSGGDYHLMAEVVGQPSTQARRDITLVGYRPTPFAISAECERTSHARGETAAITVHLRRHDGSPIAAATLRASVSFGGSAQVLVAPALDAQGTGVLRVPIPAAAEGDGTLTLTADDGASLTTIIRPLPLTAPTPRFTWTAASGALVAGLPNRLYLQAEDDGGQPLSVEGRIVDDTGATVTTIVTTHEGRGRCELTPLSGRQYRLQCASASTPLPTVMATGATLHLANARIPAGEPLRLTLTSTQAGEHRLTVRRRGRVVGQLTTTLSARHPQPVSIVLDRDAPGVVVISVTAADGRTVAECLAYHEPMRRLNVQVTADRARYQPGDTATLTVTVRDEHGRPAQALVGLSVADAGVTSLLPVRELPPALPAMAQLENEVARLADAACYLDRSEAGDRALDLLLGTQGWRLLLTDAAALAHATKHHRHCLFLPADSDHWPLMLPELLGQPRPALASGGPEPATAHEPPQMAPPPKPQGQVDTALRWLKMHQLDDGSWPAAVDAAAARISAWREPEATQVTTSLALMTFLGAGYDHKTPNKYKMTTISALRWLMRQAPDGHFSDDPSAQAICLEAIAESYAMTNDQELKSICEDAIAVLLQQQVQHNGQRLGWPARASDAPACDANASLAAVMALKSALSGGLAVGDGMEGAKQYLNAAWRAANGADPGERSTFPTRWDPRTNQCWLPHQPAAGLLMAVFLGHHADDPLAETLGTHVFARHLPVTPSVPLLQLYHATLGIFQLGGSRWPTWDKLTRSMLINSQLDASTGDRGGSWNPAHFDVSSRRFGRTATTALATLTLEIYYRYRQVGPATVPAADDASLPVPRTVAWEPRLRSGVDGTVTIRVPVGDQPASFNASANALDDRGALGAGAVTLAVAPELELTARWPERLAAGDHAEVLLTVHDHRQPPASEAIVSAGGQNPRTVALHDGIGRLSWPLGPVSAGTRILMLRANCDGRSAPAEHKWHIPEPALPWKRHLGGTVASDAASITAFTVPDDVRAETLTTRLVVYPSASAQLTAASTALIAEPHGCFEQVGATLYPLALAAQRFADSDGVDEAQRQRIRILLHDGLRRLFGYTCPGGGFSWWGKDPGHPVLTAYGLMMFRELAGTIPVDAVAVAEARAWLLAQRRADGRFAIPAGAWQTPHADAYIVWALLDEAPDEALTLADTIALIADDAEHSTDPYRLALSALVLDLAGQSARSAALLARLNQDDRGAVVGAQGGLLSGPGGNATIETTALAMLAWRGGDDAARRRARAAGAFLFSTCADGAFGSTQTTVLTLRALSEGSWWGKPSAASTAIQRTIDEREPFISTLTGFSNTPLVINLNRQISTVGAHTLRLTSDNATPLVWTLTMSGNRLRPDNGANAPTIAVRLSADQATVGDVVTMLATFSNGVHAVQSPLAVIPLPAGLEPDPLALRALVNAGRLAAWEWRGGAVVAYWDQWAAGTDTTLSIPCVAAIPGRFTAPAARCQPYYDSERVAWTAGPTLTIAAPPSR